MRTTKSIESDPIDPTLILKLARHIYVGSKASWEIIAEGVPQYDEAPPENA